ncbi:ABC-2 type transport system ATP-binding protein [Proteiniborus ethanoligenes]|uniref:ABC-2 type transport system ATP-binding protein n=1 Tax=Proteiniborus ethanoligenes TaxID=415015 RepID=A0A1H3MD04_9FIRM|nr:ABC transporter ATP-binding protein [Proteiniborus ethanoligenes]SDY74577.1 ABC-2 type transport system ATP-binding protein [Proteiniborus ethanoligenes]
MKELIKVNNLTKKFGDKVALKDISFEVQPGEILGIVGHNGAGKTTLVNCMVDIYKGDQGSIEYLFDKKSMYDHIGVQMQHSYFEDNAKVIDICKLYKDLTNSDVDLKALLKDFGLENEEKTDVNKLSGGNRQRLAILLTLIHQPDVIFLDELTTGLDPLARRRVWEKIKEINKEKEVTVVLTSHFLEEIEYLADRIIILNQGEIKYLGTVTNAIDTYSDGQKVIEFQLKDNRASFKLLKYNTVELTDDRYQIKTKEEEKVLIDLLSNVGIKNLVLKSPTLEDVFLKIAGYSLDKEGKVCYEEA